MKRIALLVLFASTAVFAQAPAVTPAKPAPVEVTPKTPDIQAKLDAQVAETAQAKQQADNLQAQMMQSQMREAMAPIQNDFNAQEKVITDWITSVKKANGWSDDVSYDRAQKKWFRTPPAK